MVDRYVRATLQHGLCQGKWAVDSVGCITRALITRNQCTIVMRPDGLAHHIGAPVTGTCRAARARISRMDDSLLRELDARMREVFAHSPAADLEKNLRALLSSAFARLDLVTREEFDVQRQVLLRTREKIVQLEAQVSELERRLIQKS